MLPCDHSVTGHVAIGPGYHVGGSMLAYAIWESLDDMLACPAASGGAYPGPSGLGCRDPLDSLYCVLYTTEGAFKGSYALRAPPGDLIHLGREMGERGGSGYGWGRQVPPSV
jgi:hypothetical protein